MKLRKKSYELPPFRAILLRTRNPTRSPVLPASRTHTPDEIERAKTLYEATSVSPRVIARMLGLGVNTFYRRIKLWGWRRRRLRVEELDALAVQIAASEAASADADLRAFAARVAEDRRSTVERARDAVMAEFRAREASRARITHAARSAVEGERSARALLALAKALTEIEALERESASERGGRAQEADARGSQARRLSPEAGEDVEAIRHRLSAQLEAMRSQRIADGR